MIYFRKFQKIKEIFVIEVTCVVCFKEIFNLTLEIFLTSKNI